MRQTEKRFLLRDFSVVALFCALLVAGSGAAAQGQEIVYSVSAGDWPKMGTRADGKLTALSFSFGTQASTDRGPTMEDFVLEIPVGDAMGAWWKAALMRKAFVQVLVEFPARQQKSGQRAPFAVRLGNAVVTSVHASKPKGDAGPGIAEVRLQATRFEVYTATQDASGGMKEGLHFGWDAATRKAF